MNLVLSLFPGIDILGRGFEAEGFCVVRGPDLIFGGDVREFHPPAGHFCGVIGGPPCQEFSAANRNPVTHRGLEMLNQFCRAIKESQPEWFLMENVPRVPTVIVQGYEIQRLDLNALECGSDQNRLRHFQFGSRTGHVISPRRMPAASQFISATGHRICMASEGRRAFKRDFPEFCRLQGLPETFDLPGFTMAEKYRAVGNGVPFEMARALAWSVTHRIPAFMAADLCACGCGRPIAGKQASAKAACRKRLERRRRVTTAKLAMP